MIRNNRLKVAALAASIALAMTATSAMAATPTATQLPGEGAVTGTATAGLITAGDQTINVTGNAVINWGKAGGTINVATTPSAQPGGFNIGSDAALHFAGQSAAGTMDAVLNIDVSGNPSQIMGALDDAGSISDGTSIFVANSNGIIVGAKATISSAGDVGLIANTRGAQTFATTGDAASIEFTGAGGDVSIAKGADVSGADVLVSGGGNVNVDLSAFTGGAVTVQAGVKQSASGLVKDNAGAVLTATGDFGGTTLDSFASAGNASTSGTLTLGTARMDGTLTNAGTLTLGDGFAIDGVLVNNKTVNSINANFGGLTNNGDFTATGNVSVAGDFLNNGKFTGGAILFLPFPPFIPMGFFPTALTTTGGSFTNNGQISDVNISVSGGDMTNAGVISGKGNLNVTAGNVANSGSMEVTDIRVLNGSIVNDGELTGITPNVKTASDSGAEGFTAGADYSITNTGTITSTNSLFLNANSSDHHNHNGAKNDSTGSVINTGVLQVGNAQFMDLGAHDDVNLGGTVQAFDGTKYAALSAANPLTFLRVYAGDYANPGSGYVLKADGVATVSADITTRGGAMIVGSQVKLMGNLSSVDADGVPTNDVAIVAGAKLDTDYAVRVASGKTVTANLIAVDGDQTGSESNVILQGTLAAQSIMFGRSNAVSDVFTGPAGSLSLFNNGFDPTLEVHFTGAVKTAPYNNASTNFRYNGLQVVTDGKPLGLSLDPVAYLTNGTTNGAKSAVNLLVNGDVNLTGPIVRTVGANGSAVTGVVNIPNTHLVLQSSGNISVGDGGDYYWPGYVYLGNVAADADGNALPGTLGLGTITTGGEFNNVLPGDIAGASGIHFITQFPMTLRGNVVTNANAWVNFGTDLLTQAYSTGTLSPGKFFGGTQGSGTVVNYGDLDDANFHTHAPVATK